MEGKVQKTTVLLHVKHNLLLGREGDATLVRPVEDLHVENIKSLMIKKPANFSAPFLLMVDQRIAQQNRTGTPIQTFTRLGSIKSLEGTMVLVRSYLFSTCTGRRCLPRLKLGCLQV